MQVTQEIEVLAKKLAYIRIKTQGDDKLLAQIHYEAMVSTVIVDGDDKERVDEATALIQTVLWIGQFAQDPYKALVAAPQPA
jgi:hypothetical protein